MLGKGSELSVWRIQPITGQEIEVVPQTCLSLCPLLFLLWDRLIQVTFMAPGAMASPPPPRPPPPSPHYLPVFLVHFGSQHTQVSPLVLVGPDSFLGGFVLFIFPHSAVWPLWKLNCIWESINTSGRLLLFLHCVWSSPEPSDLKSMWDGGGLTSGLITPTGQMPQPDREQGRLRLS